jgi:hypothetical protein
MHTAYLFKLFIQLTAQYAMLIIVIATFSALMLLGFATVQSDHAERTEVARADVAAANFWLYHIALSQYAFAHPAQTGTIADTVLTFQMGYQRNPAWTNTVDQGVLYMFSRIPLTPGTIAAIAQRGGATRNIGTAKNAVMSSWNNTSSYPLPGIIPNSAVVVIGN